MFGQKDIYPIRAIFWSVQAEGVMVEPPKCLGTIFTSILGTMQSFIGIHSVVSEKNGNKRQTD